MATICSICSGPIFAGSLLHRQQLLRGASLVDHVNRLVGQVQVLQVPRRQRHRRLERFVGVADAVMDLVMRAEALENLQRLGLGRLQHVDLLEAARQRAVAVERLLHVAERRRPDAPQRPARQRRLQEIAGVHRAAGRGAGADQRVNLVDEQNGVLFLRQAIEHLLDALFEVAAIPRAGDERAEVEREHLGVLQHLGHVALMNAQRQTLGERRLADAWLADEQRVVLAPAAEHLDHPLELERPADERVDLSFGGTRDQIRGVGLERIAAGRRRADRRSPARPASRSWAAVRDHTEQRQAIDALRAQEVRRVALFLAQDEHQQAAAVHVRGARHRGVHHRLLHDAVEAKRRFRLDRARGGHGRKRLRQHLLELPLHDVHVRAAGDQNPPRLRLVGDGDEQMLEANGVVPKVGRQPERALDRLQRLRREGNRALAHSASIVTSSGNSCSSASCLVVFTFVWATS